ncbi:MAG: hypothetical protein MMC33_010533 [Icmadophila ericetorum]|nr:hypothetical protein [Icmadophila ericetorum]
MSDSITIDPRPKGGYDNSRWSADDDKTLQELGWAQYKDYFDERSVQDIQLRCREKFPELFKSHADILKPTNRQLKKAESLRHALIKSGWDDKQLGRLSNLTQTELRSVRGGVGQVPDWDRIGEILEREAHECKDAFDVQLEREAVGQYTLYESPSQPDLLRDNPSVLTQQSQQNYKQPLPKGHGDWQLPPSDAGTAIGNARPKGGNYSGRWTSEDDELLIELALITPRYQFGMRKILGEVDWSLAKHNYRAFFHERALESLRQRWQRTIRATVPGEQDRVDASYQEALARHQRAYGRVTDPQGTPSRHPTLTGWTQDDINRLIQLTPLPENILPGGVPDWPKIAKNFGNRTPDECAWAFGVSLKLSGTLRELTPESDEELPPPPPPPPTDSPPIPDLSVTQFTDHIWDSSFAEGVAWGAEKMRNP